MSWVLIWVIFTGIDDSVVTSTATQTFVSESYCLSAKQAIEDKFSDSVSALCVEGGTVMK